MTIAARARRVQHRLARARSWAEVVAIGDTLGVDRDLPLPVYYLTLRRRFVALAAWTMTVEIARNREGR